MGQFIEQVQKNNQLQKEILTEKQERTLERENKNYYKKILLKYQVLLYDAIEEGTDSSSVVDNILEDARHTLKSSGLTQVEQRKLLQTLEEYYLKKQQKQEKTINANNFNNAENELYNYLSNYYKKYGIYIYNNIILNKFIILDALQVNHELTNVERIKLDKKFDSINNALYKTAMQTQKINDKYLQYITTLICWLIVLLLFIIL